MVTSCEQANDLSAHCEARPVWLPSLFFCSSDRSGPIPNYENTKSIPNYDNPFHVIAYTKHSSAATCTYSPTQPKGYLYFLGPEGCCSWGDANELSFQEARLFFNRSDRAVARWLGATCQPKTCPTPVRATTGTVHLLYKFNLQRNCNSIDVNKLCTLYAARNV